MAAAEDASPVEDFENGPPAAVTKLNTYAGAINWSLEAIKKLKRRGLSGEEVVVTGVLNGEPASGTAIFSTPPQVLP